MKKILSISFFILATAMVFIACTKVDDLPYYSDGTIVALTANKTAVTATPADTAANVITFNWTSPSYASEAATWKFLLEMDTSATFATKTTKEFIGVNTGSITGKEFTNMLLKYGVAIGAAKDIHTRIVSSYGNNNERYVSNVLKIAMTPFDNPAALVSEKTSVTGSLATANNHSNTFSWGGAFNGYTGDVTYVLQYDSATKNFASLKEMPVGVNMFNKALTVGEMNQTALNEGVGGSATGKIEYRIKATTAQGAISYSNIVSVTIQAYIPFYNFYLVGSINGWDINNPWPLISDRAGTRWGKVFYTYAKLNAGDAFLFVKTIGDWGSKHGSTGGGAGGIYDIGAPNTGADFTVSASGIYRLTIDLNANKVYIQQKEVGVVGNMQGWNPGSPITGGYLQRDKFLILAPSNGTDAFKFHDGPVWDNSSPDKARWWGSGASAGFLDNDGNGPDIVANSTPYTRAIWDGTDPQQVKYSISAGQLRIVGGAANIGNWDPNSAMNMNYMGNGIWTATLTLTATTPFKFVSSEGWSYNYGGNGGASPNGSLQVNGPDLSRPAGTYTVTVNEYTQTYTIN